MLTSLFEWLEDTAIATTVGQSLTLTGLLSAIHLLGMTLLVGSAVVTWLRLLGVLLPERPVPEISRAVGNAMLLGLTVSVTTGLLLFAPRASSVAANSTFQLKMVLLLLAGVFHFTLFRRVTRRREPMSLMLRLGVAVGPMLWFGVALSGAWFILFE